MEEVLRAEPEEEEGRAVKILQRILRSYVARAAARASFSDGKSSGNEAESYRVTASDGLLQTEYASDTPALRAATPSALDHYRPPHPIKSPPWKKVRDWNHFQSSRLHSSPEQSFTIRLL